MCHFPVFLIVFLQCLNILIVGLVGDQLVKFFDFLIVQRTETG